MQDARIPIAIGHAAFLGGGAEAVTLWAIQSLQSTYDVTLFTLLKPDFAELNARYGTSIRTDDLRVVTVFEQSWLSDRLYSNLSLFTLRQQVLGRKLRQSADKYCILISTYNELDLGRPGLQYIHSPFFGAYNSEVRKVLDFPDSSFRKLVKVGTRILCGGCEKRIGYNLSVTNSRWTACLLKRSGIDAEVLYPPVHPMFNNDGTAGRRNSDFLCIGRFGRDKKLEVAIDILDQLRSQGMKASLKIVGAAHDSEYRAELEILRKPRAEWLSFEENVSRSRIAHLLSEYRFGIQPREAEQFGIAVAEMAASGCIPFVPSNGGQAEIVSNDPLLLFDTVEEAATKIAHVYRDIELQQALQQKLLTSQAQFSSQAFMMGFKKLVDGILSHKSEQRVNDSPCTTPRSGCRLSAPVAEEVVPSRGRVEASSLQ